MAKILSLFYLVLSSLSSILSVPLVSAMFFLVPRFSAEAAIRRSDGTCRGVVTRVVSREGVYPSDSRLSSLWILDREVRHLK